jgi:hypothetical protein
MNLEDDELLFIINDLKEQLRAVKNEKKLIETRYKRLINKIINAKTKRINMTKEQDEIIGPFRMEL